MKRIFIVGCPRSGTTLVQKLLAASKNMYTCRETHYFQRIRRRGKEKLLDYLVLSPGKVLEAYKFICSNNELRKEYDPRKIRSLRFAALFFDQIMTSEAEARGKSAWVEKTPGHLFHIRLIKRYIPSAQFIHVIRDGRDVVASLVDAADKFPEMWKKHSDLEGAIRFYNTRLEESLKYLGKEGHIFVRYEHILDDVPGVSHKLYQLLGLQIEDLEDMGMVHQQVVRSDEGWKSGSVGGIKDTRLVKFNRILNDEQKELITKRVKILAPSLERELV